MGGRLSSFFFGRKEIRVVILGLYDAGKTTLLYRMKLGEVITTTPTLGFNVETVKHKKLTFNTWDVGGRDKVRPLWRHYLVGVQAVVYVVDSADRERLSEVREELGRVLQEEELREAAVLVLANKQDVEGCLSVQELSQRLDFPALTRHRQAAALFPVSVRNDVGVAEALDWLVDQVSVTQARNFLLSQTGCVKKAWSVRALLKSSLSSTRSLLYSKPDPQLTGNITDLQPRQ